MLLVRSNDYMYKNVCKSAFVLINPLASFDQQKCLIKSPSTDFKLFVVILIEQIIFILDHRLYSPFPRPLNLSLVWPPH